MRTTKCVVLLVLLTGTAFAHSTCEEDLQQELEREREEDSNIHGCRACKIIALEAGPNCPPKDYDCDESLPLTSNALSLDSCACAELRCAAANATLAVEQEIVKKVRCKDHKWTSRLGEAESAVCARPCGLRICPAFPLPTTEEQLTMEPVVVRPPDADHPCAWAKCEYGAHVEYDTPPLEETLQGEVSFACTGNARWRQIGTDGEKRDLKKAYCFKQLGCPLLEELSIATCTAYLSSSTDGFRCFAAARNEKTITCIGSGYPAPLQLYPKGHDKPPFDETITMNVKEARCKAGARTWEFLDGNSNSWLDQAWVEQNIGAAITVACLDRVN